MRCYRQALYVYNEKSWHLAEVCVLLLLAFLFFTSVFFSEETFYRGRVSSVGRALDCRAGGRGFDSRRQLRSEGTSFVLQKARPSRGSEDHVKIVSLISTFVLNTLTLK